MPWPHRRIIVANNFAGANPGDELDPDVVIYIAAFGITDPTEIAATNTFIVALKAAGLYTKFKRLQLFSPTSSAAALGDFITLTSMTLVNAPTFATTGFTTDGTTNYINTGFVPSTGFAANSDFMYSVYLRSATAGVSRYAMGANQAVNGRPTNFYGVGASYNFTPGALICIATGNVATLPGLTSGSTGGATDARLLKDGVEVVNNTASAAKARVTTAIYLMANNNNGAVTAGSYLAGEICFWCAATNFTSVEIATLYSLVQTFETNVISGGRQV